MTAEIKSVTEVWATQIQNLKKYGYSLNKKEIPLPDKTRLKSGFSFLVDYGTPMHIQCQKLGIKNCLKDDFYKKNHSKTKGKWGWIYKVNDGEMTIGLSVDDEFEKFK